MFLYYIVVKPLASIKELDIKVVGIINIIKIINLNIYYLDFLILSLNIKSFKALLTFFIILILDF